MLEEVQRFYTKISERRACGLDSITFFLVYYYMIWKAKNWEDLMRISSMVYVIWMIHLLNYYTTGWELMNTN